MKSEQELNADILKITMCIKDNYPELSKFIEEMPVTIPDVHNLEITRKNLSTYYDSLKAMVSGYIAQKTRTQL